MGTLDQIRRHIFSYNKYRFNKYLTDFINDLGLEAYVEACRKDVNTPLFSTTRRTKVPLEQQLRFEGGYNDTSSISPG